MTKTVTAVTKTVAAVPRGLRAPIDDELQLTSHWNWSGRHGAPGASADAAIAEGAARVFLAEHARDAAPGMGAVDIATRGDDGASGSDDGERLVVVANAIDENGVRTIGFAQRWRGVEVVGGQLQVVIAHDAIIAVMSRVVPCVDAIVATRRSLVERWFAARNARTRAGSTSTNATTSSTDATSTGTAAPTSELVILPMVRGGRASYEVAERTSGPRGDVYVSLDGRELTRTSRMRDAVATLVYDVPVRGPMGERENAPAKDTFMLLDGSSSVTDPNGAFGFGGAGVVRPDVKGTQVIVTDQSGMRAMTTLQATNGQTLVWSEANNELADAQLSAYIHARIAKDHARVVVPAVATWANETLVVSVNEMGVACNANAADDGLHFFRATAQCENTARIADVVYHETGHLVHANAIIAGAGLYSAPLSEGLADFFAATITRDHRIAIGYALDERPVRDIDPEDDERAAPGDLVPEPHLSGLVISGALWDLRKLLIAAHGDSDGNTRVYRIFASIAARAPSIQGAYLPALVGNDDDGNLENGTPDQCLIDRAFARHGLAAKTVELTSIGAPVIAGLKIDVPVVTPTASGPGAAGSGLGCPQPRVKSMRVTWRTGDAASGSPLNSALTGGDTNGASEYRVFELFPDQNGEHWTGSLPPQEDYVRVHYSIDATFDDGATHHLPDNRADREYELLTGRWDEISCQHFDADPHWDQQQQGVPAKWEFGPPRGQSFDPTAAFTGDNVWGTVLSGDGKYTPTGATQTTSPVVDATGYERVHVRLRRWLTVEDGTYDQATVQIGGTTLWANEATEEGSRDHIDREWRIQDLDATAYATAPFAVTWRITGDAQRELGGWNLDDVCIVGAPSKTREPVDHPDGCCSVGGDPVGGSACVGFVVLGLRRRRRRTG